MTEERAAECERVIRADWSHTIHDRLRCPKCGAVNAPGREYVELEAGVAACKVCDWFGPAQLV